jgi:hypothetical protein
MGTAFRYALFSFFFMAWSVFAYATQIKKAEYFWDTDPGVGNGILCMPFTASDSVHLNQSISTSGLSAGIHLLYIRTQSDSGVWSLSEGRPIRVESELVIGEYFWDSDPGIGQGNPIPIYFPTDSLATTFYGNTQGLSKGVHQYFTRFRNVDGQWSLAEGRPITMISPIQYAEYFWDTDPGQGNGLPVTLWVTGDSINTNLTISTAGLPGGYHMWYMRTQDADGDWALSEGRSMYVQPQIIGGESFWDTDPGLGNGLPIYLWGYTDSLATNFNPSTTGLSKGYHTYYTRFKNSDLTWGLSEGRVIKVTTPIIAAEYFIDTDPGQGNATSLPIVAGEQTQFDGTITLPNLSEGLHRLCIRTKQLEGAWSMVEVKNFWIQTIDTSTTQQIVATEYYFDTDPGQGNGNSISINPSAVVNWNHSIPVPSSLEGLHRIYWRTQDNHGKWSMSETRMIYLLPPIIHAAEITAVEYYFDTDPGVGNATSLPITAGGPTINACDFISVPNLSLGNHRIYFRTKDNLQHWSLHEGKSFSVVNSSNVDITANSTSVCPNTNATMTAFTTNGYANYQWYKDCDPIDGATTATYVPLSAGHYWVTVSKLGQVQVDDVVLYDSCYMSFSLKLFLQGYYMGSGSMQSVLANQGENPNTSLTDFIDVKAYDKNTLNFISSGPGILFTDGTVSCSMSPVYDSVYLCISHRNTIQTWSANPVLLSNQFNYDFTTAASQAFGDNQIEVEPGVFALYTGDIDQDGFIDSFDFPLLDTDIFNGANGYYMTTDLNGDGFVDSFDYPIFDVNSFNGVSVISP